MKILKISGIVAVAVAGGTVLTLFLLNPKNSAETTEGSTDEALITRRYKTAKNISAISEDIKILLGEQITYGRRWQVVGDKIENNSAIIKAEVPVVIFTDDLEVRIDFEPSKDFDKANEIIINARSASRIGDSDFGENRRHIKQILKAIDLYFRSE